MYEIYVQAADRGPVTDEQLTQIMEDNADLGMYLHLYQSSEVSVRKGTKMEGTRYANLYDNGVAVLDLIGPIYPRANMMTMSGATSIAQFTNDFIKAYSNPAVRAIVLNVDSPGGDVRGIGDAAELMHRLTRKGKKPVKTFASGYMASAAYYIGSIGQEIIGSKSSLSGSIGVVMTARAKGKDEIEITSSQSPNKRVDPSTDEGVAIIRQRLDDLADIFISDVAKYRGITVERVLSHYGQGDYFVGPRAKKQGLIDRIGTFSSVVEEAAKEANESRRPIRQSFEAIEGTDTPSILQFTEEDTMGLKDLLNKFKASDDTVLDDAQAQDAKPVAEESDESTDAATDPVAPPITVGTIGATPGLPAVTREELEERFSDSAELFAVNMTTSSKIYPSQQAHAASDFINAKIDDTLHGGMVTFVDSEGKLTQGTREAAVRAKYEAMPKHSMTQEAIKGIKDGSVTAKVLAEVDPDKAKAEGPVSEERRRHLLSLTEQGQQVLAQQK